MTAPRRVSRAAIAALTASVVTLALASWTWEEREGAPRVDPPVTDVAPPSAPKASATTADPARPMPTRTPVEIRIGGIGIRMPVVPEGVTTDGQMSLPAKPSTLGWYRFGAKPGQRGSTVLAGHVDTKRFGIGPLAQLPEVEAGATIRLRLSDGSTLWYRVAGLRSVDKQSRALESVFDESGPSRLRIVTCGGKFDPQNGGYQDNVVLTAVPLTAVG